MKRFPFFSLMLLAALGLSSCYDMMYYKQNEDQAQTDAANPSTTVEDTVYLKDGSILHGKIVEEVPGVSLKIQIKSGNIFTYQMSDVDKITHAKVYSGQ